MNQDSLKILEYDKVKAMLAERTTTLIGREKATSLLPTDEYEDIQELLDETDEAMKIICSVNPPMGGFRDIRSAVKKTQLGLILELNDFVDIMSTLYAIRQMKKFFKEIELSVPILRGWAHDIEILGQLEKNLENAIDEHGNLRDDATMELSRIRRELKSSQRRIKESLSKVLHDADNQKYFQEAIVTIRENRYVIPVKSEYRQKIPGIIHDQSSTGATVFIEPMSVVELNNDIKQLELQEEHEVARIMQSLSTQISRNSEALLADLEIFGRLDFVFARAKLADDMHAVRPIVNDNGETHLVKARHPLIPAGRVVPIDISLGETFRMMLVTGPNTGGKTVSMKTLGLLSLMAQSGLFIPAAVDSRIGVYKNIYADIGDEQSIEQSLSTFSAHMKRIVGILDVITSDDLLLLDEIGAGTDPEEGAALAMAILENLYKRNVSTVATTHYSELKTFAYENEGIENACVEFDTKSLRPTYRLLIGIPGASNAFAISSRLGLSDTLIDRARELIQQDHARFEVIVNGLEKEKSSYEKLNDELDIKKRSIEALEAKLEAERDEIKKRKEKIINDAHREGTDIIRRAKREADDVIKELKAEFNDHGIRKRQQVISDSRSRLDKAVSGMSFINGDDDAYSEVVNLDTLAVGDKVYVTSLGQKGTVESIKGQNLTIDLGNLRTTVKAENCRFVAKKSKVTHAMPRRSTSAILNKMSNVRREIDIRGMLVDEGEQAVGKFLDDALLAGLKDVLIIHGKGTGALRKGIHEYLKRQPYVKSFAFADIDEGGTGATVVNLKK